MLDFRKSLINGTLNKVLKRLARRGNLWVVIDSFFGWRVGFLSRLAGPPAVDKAPAHRTSLWTAATRYVTCPPLPDLEPMA